MLEPVLRAALDIRFMGYETFHKSVGGWTTIAVWSVLNTISVRHITVNRRLSRQFAVRSTPDTLRRPVTARALAGISGMPYATVWRHLAVLERAGRLGHSDDGYVVQTEQLLKPEVEQLVVAYVVDVMNRVERLIAEGLDPEAVPSMFLGTKPELVPVRS